MDLEYEQLLANYCGFRADVLIARACCDRPRADPTTPEEQLQLVARHLDSAFYRTAIEPALYRLIDLRDGTVWDFHKADHVADMMFVRTMWPPHAAVYKKGVRYSKPLAGEIGALARALEVWAPKEKA
jgi:hypothetical protein